MESWRTRTRVPASCMRCASTMAKCTKIPAVSEPHHSVSTSKASIHRSFSFSHFLLVSLAPILSDFLFSSIYLSLSVCVSSSRILCLTGTVFLVDMIADMLTTAVERNECSSKAMNLYAVLFYRNLDDQRGVLNCVLSVENRRCEELIDVS